MLVPNYIKQLLTRRERAAMIFNECDYKISEWCTKHQIELEECDCFGGVESIVHPSDSKERILEAIHKK